MCETYASVCVRGRVLSRYDGACTVAHVGLIVDNVSVVGVAVLGVSVLRAQTEYAPGATAGAGVCVCVCV